MGTLVSDDRRRFVHQALEHPSSCQCFRRQETGEAKLVNRQTGGSESGQQRGRSRYGNYGHSMLDRLGDHAVARIRNQGSSGIAHERHRFSPLERGENFRAAPAFIVLVVAHQRLADLEVLQELLRLPRVFACN